MMHETNTPATAGDLPKLPDLLEEHAVPQSEAPNPRSYHNVGYLGHLYSIVEGRKAMEPSDSYIASLYHKGTDKIAQKVGEEAVETVIEAMKNNRHGLINESADLLFHLLILLADRGVPLEYVFAEMYQREGISGLREKTK